MSKWPYSTQRWQRYRRMKLRQNPLCEYCLNEGQLTPAVAVDHIVAIAKGGDPFPPLDHVMSCCTSCHNRKTNIVEQQGKPWLAAEREVVSSLSARSPAPKASAPRKSHKRT
jgi:5-methylcytosine-specific restriction endonuclease McrA